MPLINPKSYVLRRYSRTFVDGVVTDALEAIGTVFGDLQPMSDGEIQNLPEGFRSQAGEKFKLYTNASVELTSRQDTFDGEPDRVEYNGKDLFVHGLLSWSHGLLPHKKYLLIKPVTETERDA